MYDLVKLQLPSAMSKVQSIFYTNAFKQRVDFYVQGYALSKIEILTNTTNCFDEQLQQRLSLIPFKEQFLGKTIEHKWGPTKSIVTDELMGALPGIEILETFKDVVLHIRAVVIKGTKFENARFTTVNNIKYNQASKSIEVIKLKIKTIESILNSAKWQQ